MRTPSFTSRLDSAQARGTRQGSALPRKNRAPLTEPARLLKTSGPVQEVKEGFVNATIAGILSRFAGPVRGVRSWGAELPRSIPASGSALRSLSSVALSSVRVPVVYRKSYG